MYCYNRAQTTTATTKRYGAFKWYEFAAVQSQADVGTLYIRKELLKLRSPKVSLVQRTTAPYWLCVCVFREWLTGACYRKQNMDFCLDDCGWNALIKEIALCESLIGDDDDGDECSTLMTNRILILWHDVSSTPWWMYFLGHSHSSWMWFNVSAHCTVHATSSYICTNVHIRQTTPRGSYYIYNPKWHAYEIMHMAISKCVSVAPPLPAERSTNAIYN